MRTIIITFQGDKQRGVQVVADGLIADRLAPDEALGVVAHALFGPPFEAPRYVRSMEEIEKAAEIRAAHLQEGAKIAQETNSAVVDAEFEPTTSISVGFPEDTWLIWTRAPQPVGDNVMVDIIDTHGAAHSGYACFFSWDHKPGLGILGLKADVAKFFFPSKSTLNLRREAHGQS